MPKGKVGGKQEGAGRKEGAKNKTAQDLMNELGYPKKWLSPLKFCLAVMNNDIKAIGHKVEEPEEGVGRGKYKRPISISQRIEAARIATPYFHQKLPDRLELEAGDSWADMIREAEERERKMMEEYRKKK